MANVDVEDWAEQADCRGANAVYFYPPIGQAETDEDRYKRESFAKLICSNCIVQTECHEFADRTRQIVGIWGGETEAERIMRTNSAHGVLTVRDGDFIL